MKKYPYIGQRYSIFILFYEEGEGVLIGDALGLEYDSSVGDKVNFAEGVDVTHEYLQNTWGIVESKEHAEFIIEIAELHGFELTDTSDTYGEFFCFDSGSICFVYLESVAKHSCKQIKIPLPPKAKEEERISYTIKKGIQAKNGCEDFEITGVDSIGCAATVSVSFNDSDEIINIEIENLPPKAKEWPKVGDEVLICDKVNLLELSRFNGKKCEVIGICSNGNDKVLTVKAEHQGVAAFNMGDWIKKPKSKQDPLIEELHQKLLANNCSDEYLLACDIVQGKIEGLSYE